MNKKKAILIFGPPRSGTSLAANIFEKLGVYFGDKKDFIDPNEIKINPIFYELKKINQINNKILKVKQFNYDEFTHIPDFNDLNSKKSLKLILEIDHFMRKYFKSKNLIGIKDPRLSYTFPYWKKVLKKLNFTIIPILCIRNINENISSNIKTNNFNKYNNVLLSHTHILSSIKNLKNENFYVYDYNKIMRGDLKIIQNVCSVIKIKFSKTKFNSIIRKSLKSCQAESNNDYFNSFIDFKKNNIETFINFLNSFKGYYDVKILKLKKEYSMLLKNYRIIEKNINIIEKNYFKVYDDLKKLNEKNSKINFFSKLKKPFV